MTTKKKTQQAPPVEEWTVKEWEIAYGAKCKELEKMREVMRAALVHLTKAV